jgi:[ribosomal protein S5]-alanine N-acetyltransferase
MIILREFTEGDAQRLVEIANNPAVSQYMVDRFPSPFTRDDAWWWIRTGSRSGVTRVIEFGGVFVGSIRAEPRSGEKLNQYEVGYFISEPYWGNGIATEALTLFADELSKTAGIERLQAWVYTENAASIRVLQKAGFTKDAESDNVLYKNGRLFEEYIYPCLRS